MKWDAFDIIGPIMVGPSSSHTSGAVRLGLFAQILLGGVPDKAKIYLHGSYATVYKGHGTDKSLLAGLLGFAPDSEKVVNAFSEAKKAGLDYEFIITDLGSEYHPNTAKFELQKGKEKIEVVGESIGGGAIEITEINGIKTHLLNGKDNTLLILHQDKPGILASVTKIIANNKVNIGQMHLAREKKAGSALTVVTTDEPVSPETILEMDKLPEIKWVKVLPKLN